MARRSLADQAKLEALRIAELCRLFHRDAAVRARLEDVLILERRANIAAVRNIKKRQAQMHLKEMERRRARVAAAAGAVAAATIPIVAPTAPARMLLPMAMPLLPPLRQWSKRETNHPNTQSSCLS